MDTVRLVGVQCLGDLALTTGDVPYGPPATGDALCRRFGVVVPRDADDQLAVGTEVGVERWGR